MMRREDLLAHYARVRAHYRNLAPAYSREANQTCEGRYRDIVRRVMSGRARVLELGSGSNDLLDRVGPPGSVACDLSIDMLQQRSPETKFDTNVNKYVDERLLDELEKEGFFKRMGGKT